MTGERASKGEWFVLLCVVLLCVVTGMELTWLLWQYVPLHAAFLASLTSPLPVSTRIAIASSSWFVRLLPLAVVVALFSGVLGAAALAVVWQRLGSRRVVAWLTRAGVTVSLLGVLSCTFLVVSIETVVEPVLLGRAR